MLSSHSRRIGHLGHGHLPTQTLAGGGRAWCAADVAREQLDLSVVNAEPAGLDLGLPADARGAAPEDDGIGRAPRRAVAEPPQPEGVTGSRAPHTQVERRCHQDQIRRIARPPGTLEGQGAVGHAEELRLHTKHFGLDRLHHVVLPDAGFEDQLAADGPAQRVGLVHRGIIGRAGDGDRGIERENRPGIEEAGGETMR